MIRIQGGTYESIRFVVDNMRAADRLELEATSPNISNGDLARGILAKSELVFVALLDGEPVSCWGMIPMWPGVGYAFAFGTDDWGKVLLQMTRFVRGFMVAYLLDNGYHRIETRSLASRQDVGRWLKIFGAKAEAVLRGSGARGEDFVLYRWLAHERPAEADDHAPPGNGGGRRPAGDPVRHVLP